MADFYGIYSGVLQFLLISGSAWLFYSDQSAAAGARATQGGRCHAQ